MIRVLPFLALLFAGCTAPAFSVTLSNVGDATTFVTAGEGSGPLLRIEVQEGGAWVPAASNRASLCMPICGLPGPIVCADVAAELGGVHALLPGDRVTREWETQWYVEDSAGCLRETNLSGPTRVQVCHGPDAVGAEDGLPLDAPTTSGFLDGGGSGASIEAPNCELFDIEIVASGGVVVVEISD